MESNGLIGKTRPSIAICCLCMSSVVFSILILMALTTSIFLVTVASGKTVKPVLIYFTRVGGLGRKRMIDCFFPQAMRNQFLILRLRRRPARHLVTSAVPKRFGLFVGHLRLSNFLCNFHHAEKKLKLEYSILRDLMSVKAIIKLKCLTVNS